MNEIKTLSQFLRTARDRHNEAIQYKENRRWKTLTWSEYVETVEAWASALLNLGVQVGEHVAIFSSTRFEWAIADLGNIAIQAVTIPIYHTMTADELEYILNNSEAKVLICENESLLKLFETVSSRCHWVETVIVLDLKLEKTGVESFAKLLEQGRQDLGKNRREIQKREESANSETPLTIVYTSGTTGVPKGVLLTHEQAVSEITEAFHYVGAETSDISLTFLPYSHILGRIEMWGHLAFGFKMAFAESIERIPTNLREIRPTIMIAVPRIFEKVYLRIQAKIESSTLQKRLFAWALKIGRRVGELKLKHQPVPLHLIPEYEVADRLLLRKVRDAFGGRLRFAISGGAPMNRDIALFFHACGVLLLEGYGLTETTAAIAVHTPYDYNFGTVGKPFGDVKFKIAEDGEILVKSKKVMKGYYKDPESTARAITDGWYHTGDIGEITDSGEIRITDRKKDLIKTAGGKYVAPQKIEGLLKSFPLISHVHIHGDQRKFIVALITLDKNYVTEMAMERGISFPTFAALTQNLIVVEMVRKAVAEANSHLASFETIKRFHILSDDFTIESGELTPSLKIKRKAVDTKFKRELDALYL